MPRLNRPVSLRLGRGELFRRSVVHGLGCVRFFPIAQFPRYLHGICRVVAMGVRLDDHVVFRKTCVGIDAESIGRTLPAWVAAAATAAATVRTALLPVAGRKTLLETGSGICATGVGTPIREARVLSLLGVPSAVGFSRFTRYHRRMVQTAQDEVLPVAAGNGLSLPIWQTSSVTGW